MSRRSVTFGDARLARVTAYAAASELEVSELVRRAIDFYMDGHPVDGAQVSRGPMQGAESTHSEAGTKRGGEAHRGCDGVVVVMPAPAPPSDAEPPRETITGPVIELPEGPVVMWERKPPRETITGLSEKRIALRAWKGDVNDMPAPVYVEKCLEIYEDAAVPEADVPIKRLNQWAKLIGQPEVLALLQRLAAKGHLDKGDAYIGGAVNKRKLEIEADEADTRRAVERDAVEHEQQRARLTPQQRAAEDALAEQRRIASRQRLAAKGIHVG